MRTYPTRSIAHAPEDVEDAIRKEDLLKDIQTPTPTEKKKLGELERLERQIALSTMALNKYERKLEGDMELTDAEERLFLAHQDSVRKLEVSLSQLKTRSSIQQKSDLDIALEMIDRGMEAEDIMRVFGGNKELASKLREAMADRD